MMKELMKKGWYLKAVLAFIMAAWMILPASADALAAGRVDVDQKGEMSLEYIYDEQVLAGAKVRVYRTSDITETARYILSGDFQDYPVNLENLDSEGWRAAANTLAVYAAADQLEPLLSGTVDTVGMLELGILDTGLYLFVAEDIEIDGKNYHSEPFLVSLPSLDETDIWNYDVKVRPKSTECEPIPQLVDLTVIKVWNDGSQSGSRPQEIKVSLLKDNEVYEQVSLSASNYWRHTWTGLDSSHTWKAVETGVPSGYTVTYTDGGTVYTITNTIKGNTPGGGGGSHGGGPHDSGKKYSPTTEIPEGDTPLANVDVPEEITDEQVPLARLPQTGLLWWPVPFLAMGGLLLLGLGYKDYHNEKRNKNGK